TISLFSRRTRCTSSRSAGPPNAVGSTTRRSAHISHRTRSPISSPIAAPRFLLPRARRAIGAGRGLVGEQRCRGQPDIRHAIGAGQALRQGARLDQSIGADIGPKINEYFAAHAEDRAVAAAGDLDLAIR